MGHKGDYNKYTINVCQGPAIHLRGNESGRATNIYAVLSPVSPACKANSNSIFLCVGTQYKITAYSEMSQM